MYDFLERYKTYYRAQVLDWPNFCLFQQEALISRLIDSDDYSNLLSFDEITALYDIIRDECVRRVGLPHSSVPDV